MNILEIRGRLLDDYLKLTLCGDVHFKSTLLFALVFPYLSCYLCSLLTSPFGEFSMENLGDNNLGEFIMENLGSLDISCICTLAVIIFSLLTRVLLSSQSYDF